jgi:hypothetical protein
MKTFTISAILALVSVSAAHADMTPRQIAYQLRSPEATWQTGIFAGLILGFERDPQVCVGDATIGSIQERLAEDMVRYSDESSANANTPMNDRRSFHAILNLMQHDYPCK